MKKILPFWLALMLALSLTACGKEAAGNSHGPGIPGMAPEPLLAAMEAEPFRIPQSEPEALEDGASYTGQAKNTDGLTFSYTVQVDGEGWIRQAELLISAKRMSDSQMTAAAVALCRAVADNPYEGADPETLGAWFTENLASAPSYGVSTVVGGAEFTLYGIPELNYTLKIQPAE